MKISLLVSCKKHLWKKIPQSLKVVHQSKNEFTLYIFSSPDNYSYSSIFIESILCFCCSYVNELNFSESLQSVPLEETEIGKIVSNFATQCPILPLLQYRMLIYSMDFLYNHSSSDTWKLTWSRRAYTVIGLPWFLLRMLHGPAYHRAQNFGGNFILREPPETWDVWVTGKILCLLYWLSLAPELV